MKFKIYTLLPFFIIGILTFNYNNSIIHILCIFLFITSLFLSIYKKNIIWVFFFVFFMVGGGTILINKHMVNEKYKRILEYREFNGKIIDVKKDSITIKNTSEGYNITFFIPKNLKNKYEFYLGDRIYLKGKANKKEIYRENSMASRGLTAYASIREVVEIDKKIDIFNLPLKIKEKINKGLSSVESDAGAFVSGLVTGYRSSINEEDMDTFTQLDIVHIIAVSGFNVAIIYAVTMILTKRLETKKRLIISLLLCAVYISITGFDPSITRAFIMITMVIIGRLIGKRYSTLNGLSVAGFLMLSINPFYIYNLGFIFSFLATLSIAIFCSDIIVKVEGYSKLFKDEIGATVSSTILTFPIVIYNRGYFSLISLIVNILLAPLVSLITILGFVSSFIYVIIPFSIILYPVVFLGDITLKLIRLFGEVNQLVYTGQPTLLFFVFYYFSVLFIFNIIKFKKRFYKYLLIGFMIIIIAYQGFINSSNLKIHFINVGQGDSIFIELPGRKSALIDTGDAKEDYVAAKSKVVPYMKKLGYNKIDYLFITHFHSDHAGGLDYLESSMKIHNKVTYEGAENKDFIEVLKGDVLTSKGVTFNVMSPESSFKYEDENKNSLIISLHYKGFSGLFTGDATKEEMDRMSGSFNVLKVPHHGSKYSVSEKMLESSHIETAVITVGKNNFSHPSNESLDSLSKRNIKTYRTDKHGNIVYIVNSKGYKIRFKN